MCVCSTCMMRPVADLNGATAHRFDIFRGHRIDPCRHLRAMLLDIGVYAMREGGQDLVHVSVDLVLVLNHTFLRAEQTLQVISIPTVFVRDEVQVAISERAKSLDL